MMLVTLEEAKAHLRMDHAYDDADITLKVHAASAAVLNYLKKPESAYEQDSNGVIEDSNGPIVLYEVRAATLLMLGELYKNREGQQDGEINSQFGYGYLPRPVVALLYPLRDPAWA